MPRKMHLKRRYKSLEHFQNVYAVLSYLILCFHTHCSYILFLIFVKTYSVKRIEFLSAIWPGLILMKYHKKQTNYESKAFIWESERTFLLSLISYLQLRETLTIPIKLHTNFRFYSTVRQVNRRHQLSHMCRCVLFLVLTICKVSCSSV